LSFIYLTITQIQFKSQILSYSFILTTITILLYYLVNIPNSYGIQQIMIFNSTHNQIIQPFNPHKSNLNFNEIQKFNNPNFTQVSATTPVCNGHNINDNFDFTYNLKDRQTSPNGIWKNVYSGLGSTGVEDVNGSHVFFLKPKTSDLSNETEASLSKSTGSFCDFKADFDINTVKQLRQNSPPNTWEAGWFIFRYTDTFHYYWFLIRSDGIELGKKDCDTCTDPIEGQQFLFTKDYPILQLDKWTHWKVIMDGNHIQIFVDGTLLIDYIDDNMTSQLSSGAVAMYSEDAYVRYDNMNIQKR
jgi:hypothetical protein